MIVPTLADRGIYIASESSFYRVLKSANQLKKRSRECQYKRPDVLRAVAPNQVWSWDISYLPSWVRGQHFYLYMIVDIYSRKIIAAEVFASESGKHAAELLQRAVWNENVHPTIWYSILIMVVPCAVTRCWRKCMRLVC